MATGKGEAADPAFPSISTGRFDEIPAPPMPVIDPANADLASTQYSYLLLLHCRRGALAFLRECSERPLQNHCVRSFA